MSERVGKPMGLFGAMVKDRLDDDVPRHVYMSSKEDEPRAIDTGVQEIRAGTVSKLRPVMSRADYANLQFGMLPPVTGHEHRFMPFLAPGTRAWESFMSTRKIVEQTRLDGSYVSVTGRMSEALGQVDRAPAVGKSYRLTQLLTDPDVQVKFSLTMEVLGSLRRLAISNPDAAALQATDVLRRVRPGTRVSVVAGDYSRSRRRACDSIQEFCGLYPVLSASVESAIIGPDIFMYGPGLESSRWHVSGPLEYAKQVAQVYRAVECCGGPSVMFALGSELTILHVDILDGVSYLSPVVEKHLGDGSGLPAASSPLTSALLSLDAKMRFENMRGNIAEVLLNGDVVGSCVRISRKYSLMSSHVADAGQVQVDGVPVRRAKCLQGDLWLTEAVGPGDPSWPLREAKPGERVVVCYRGPTGGVQYTSPMSVLSADGTTIAVSFLSELSAGMSGGALVALDDMALLGIHEGVGRQQAVALAFTPTLFAVAHSASDVSPSVTRGTEGVLMKLRERGLGAYIQGCFESLKPLYYGGKFVGNACGAMGCAVTSCDPDAVPLSFEPDGRPVVFSSLSFCLYAAEGVDVVAPMLYRTPNYYERVVIVCRDEEGPYYSSVTRIMHIGANGKNFSLESIDKDNSLPYTGGLVVSLTDAAVLGVYVRQTVSPTLGLTEFCVPYPTKQDGGDNTLGRAVRHVVDRFPMLHVGTWPSGVLEEVLTHTSCQKYTVSARPFNGGMAALAFVGDSVLKVRFGERAREIGTPVAIWQSLIQTTQSNAALAAYARVLGLDTHILFGGGTSPPPPGSKVYADVLEALVGAVYLHEPTDVAMAFVDALLSGLGQTYGLSKLSRKGSFETVVG